MAIINTGAVERTITGVNESEVNSQATIMNLVENSDSGNYGNNPASDLLVEAPDGTISAVMPTPDSTSDRFEYLIDGGTYPTDTKLVYSWYRKRVTTPADATYTGDLRIVSLSNMTNVGSVTQIETDYNGFDRFQAVVNITDGSLLSKVRGYFGSPIGIGNSSVAYWGQQLELGEEARAYAPTNGTALFIDNNSTSTVNNTGAVERNITGVNESDLFGQGSRANLLKYSSDFTQSDWRKRTSDGTQPPIITRDYGLAPDGIQSASRVFLTKPSLDSSYAVLDTFILVSKNIGDEFTSSIYVKANGASQIGKEVNLYQYEDGYSTVLTHSLTNEWVRLELTDSMGLSTGNMEALTLGKARSTVGGASLSNMATDFLVAFAQFEKSSFATEYIPTSGAPVTIDNNSTSTVNNTGAVEREIEASHDANFVHPLGDELISNGSFESNDDWNLFGFTIENGSLVLNSNSSENTNQNIETSVNSTYRISFKISDLTSGGIRFRLGVGGFSDTFESNGEHVTLLEQTTTNEVIRIYAASSTEFNGKLDNISVKEVLVNRESTVNNTGAVEREIEASHDANFVHPLGDELVINGGFDSESDWDTFGSWSISEGVASFDRDLSGASNIIQEIDSLESGKSYRLSFDVLESNGGNLLYKMGIGGMSFATLSSVQPNTSYSIDIPFSSTTKKLYLRGSSIFAGSIDNVSLKELLVNRESTVTNTGAARRSIEGINESDTF